MIDTRDQILARLFDILDSEDLREILEFEHRSTFRNRGYASVTDRPAIILLDGDESMVSEGAARSARGDPAPRGYIMDLRPQIFAILKSRKGDDASEYAAEISKYRRVIISTVLFDPGVRELVGTNGKVRYVGMETDMKTGSPLEGELQFNFSFHYFLNPSDLIVT